MKFLAEKSYIWIFWVFFFAFIVAGSGLAAFGGDPEYAVVSAPVVVGIVLALEIRSGVALDSLWRAKYAKGAWQYKAVLAWHCAGLIALTVMTAIFLELCRAFPSPP